MGPRSHSVRAMNVVKVLGLWAALAWIGHGRVLRLGRQARARSARGRPIKEALPWYHSADEIHDKLNELARGGCNGADIEITQRSELNSGSAAGEVVELDVLHISRSSGASQPKKRAMMVYGEHARELISPESALHFVQALCGDGVAASRASAVLDNVSFTIVPNANPVSRRLVEEGQYCKRTNEDGVDLNRNFGDAHRATGDEPGEEMNPGPNGFSEPESRIIRDLVQEERPDIYLSIHSGAYLLGTPFGYTSDRTPENEASMMEVLKPISEKYCEGECPYGNLARLIHYKNPGCDIDFVQEAVGTPYVFTWEIYVGGEFRDRYIEQARMQRGAAEGDDGLSLAATNRSRTRASKAQLRGGARVRSERPEDSLDVEGCMNQFNPRTEAETRSVTERWTNAYLELCEEVVAKSAAPQASPGSAAKDAWPSLAAFSQSDGA